MLEESADVVPNGEAAGAVAGVGVAPKGPPAVDPNTDVEDCCGADVVAVDVPNIDDPDLGPGSMNIDANVNI